MPYSRFFHSRVMAIVSGVDRSTLFRGRAERTRAAARSRFDSRADHAFKPIARTHWGRSRFARVVARDQPHAHTSTSRDANARSILPNSSARVTSVRMRRS